MRKFIYIILLIAIFFFTNLSVAISAPDTKNHGDSPSKFSSSNLLAKIVPNSFFKPKEIALSGHSYLSAEKIFAEIGLNNSSNINSSFNYILEEESDFKFSSKVIKDSLFSLPWVKDVELKKSLFPSKLLIKIEEEVPWFVVERGLGQGSWLVSREGKWLQPLDELKESKMQYLVSSLPRLAGLNFGSSSSFSSGASAAKPENYLKTLKEFKYATHTLKVIEKNGGFPFHISRFEVLEEGGVLIEPEDFKQAQAKKIVIAFEKEEQLKSLFLRYSLVRKDLNQRGLIAEKLDLRFDGRAVVVDTKL